MLYKQKISDCLKFLQLILSSTTQRKHIWVWLLSYKKDYLFQKKLPWLPFDAIDYLLSLDLDGKKIFEYGSGGSTLFWLSKGAICVSIEHNPTWYSRVNALFFSGSKIDYRLVKPDYTKNSGDPADPKSFLSGSPDYRNYSFQRYVEQIDEFPPEYFDLVMIDGRSRPACIHHCVNKIKPGGLLVVDDVDRDYYFTYTQDLLADFTLKKFYGVGPCLDFFISTNIYTCKGNNRL